MEEIRLAGVIGDPIAHSKSPLIHGWWLKNLNIQGHYIPIRVEPNGLAEAITSLKRLGFAGVNVTIPHKETVMGLIDEASASAMAIGAANTLVFREDGSIFGDNTDAYGFYTNLVTGLDAYPLADANCLVIGAGGAAKAVIYALLNGGVGQIMIANRSPGRAKAVAEQFGARVLPIDWDAMPHHLSEVDLLVNSTSLGMVGQPELDLQLSGLRRSAVVTDLVYNPLEPKLLRDARNLGLHVVDGLGMLLHQAVPGFEYWFDERPQVDPQLIELVRSHV